MCFSVEPFLIHSHFGVNFHTEPLRVPSQCQCYSAEQVDLLLIYLKANLITCGLDSAVVRAQVSPAVCRIHVFLYVMLFVVTRGRWRSRSDRHGRFILSNNKNQKLINRLSVSLNNYLIYMFFNF